MWWWRSSHQCPEETRCASLRAALDSQLFEFTNESKTFDSCFAHFDRDRSLTLSESEFQRWHRTCATEGLDTSYDTFAQLDADGSGSLEATEAVLFAAEPDPVEQWLRNLGAWILLPYAMLLLLMIGIYAVGLYSLLRRHWRVPQLVPHRPHLPHPTNVWRLFTWLGQAVVRLNPFLALVTTMYEASYMAKFRAKFMAINIGKALVVKGLRWPQTYYRRRVQAARNEVDALMSRWPRPVPAWAFWACDAEGASRFELRHVNLVACALPTLSHDGLLVVALRSLERADFLFAISSFKVSAFFTYALRRQLAVYVHSPHAPPLIRNGHPREALAVRDFQEFERLISFVDWNARIENAYLVIRLLLGVFGKYVPALFQALMSATSWNPVEQLLSLSMQMYQDPWSCLSFVKTLGTILSLPFIFLYRVAVFNPAGVVRFSFSSTCCITSALLLAGGRAQISSWREFPNNVREHDLLANVRRYEELKDQHEGYCRATSNILLLGIALPAFGQLLHAALHVVMALTDNNQKDHFVEMTMISALVALMSLSSAILPCYMVWLALRNAIEINATSQTLANAIFAMAVGFPGQGAPPMDDGMRRDLLALHGVIKSRPPEGYALVIPVIGRVAFTKTSLIATAFLVYELGSKGWKQWKEADKVLLALGLQGFASDAYNLASNATTWIYPYFVGMSMSNFL